MDAGNVDNNGVAAGGFAVAIGERVGVGPCARVVDMQISTASKAKQTKNAIVRICMVPPWRPVLLDTWKGRSFSQ